MKNSSKLRTDGDTRETGAGDKWVGGKEHVWTSTYKKEHTYVCFLKIIFFVSASTNFETELSLHAAIICEIVVVKILLKDSKDTEANYYMIEKMLLIFEFMVL